MRRNEGWVVSTVKTVSRGVEVGGYVTEVAQNRRCEMPKKRLPTKTEILGVPYTITWHPTDEVNVVSDEDCWGMIEFSPRNIRVSNEISLRDKLLAVVEEMVHGVLSEMSYDKLGSKHKFIGPFVNGIYTALEKAGMLAKYD